MVERPPPLHRRSTERPTLQPPPHTPCRRRLLCPVCPTTPSVSQPPAAANHRDYRRLLRTQRLPPVVPSRAVNSCRQNPLPPPSHLTDSPLWRFQWLAVSPSYRPPRPRPASSPSQRLRPADPHRPFSCQSYRRRRRRSHPPLMSSAVLLPRRRELTRAGRCGRRKILRKIDE